MTHTAFARKYRPKRFRELIAQHHVATGLAGAIAKDRVAHGYLLTGPRGTGKTTAARILAMALNCERREEAGGGEPCGECDSCRRVWSGAANLDVVEIDAASNRGVDDARELRERAMYAASAPGGYKVYIIDEAHMLTREAWNALLKILEEPPPRVVFVFATTEPQKIANATEAAMSRLQRFDFRTIGPRAIVDRLREVAEAEGLTVEDDAHVLIARAAKGAMRDALSMFDQVVAFGDGPVTATGVRDALGLIDDEQYGELLHLVAERRAAEVFPFVAGLVEQGADLVEFVGGAGEALRALMVRRMGGDVEGLTGGLREVLDRVADQFTEGDVLRMLKLLEETEVTIRRSPNTRLHVETLLLQWALLDRMVDIAEILAAVRAGGAPTPPSPTGGRRPRPEPHAERHSQRPEEEAARPPGPAPVTAGPAPTTVEGLATRWKTVLDELGKTSPLVRETLARANPTVLQDGLVTIGVEGGDLEIEGLTRNRRPIEAALGKVLGMQVRARFVPAGRDPEPGPAPAESRRQTVEADREARLRTYRAQDPALDAMADALDLELLE